jgi:hypothetical protein
MAEYFFGIAAQSLRDHCEITGQPLYSRCTIALQSLLLSPHERYTLTAQYMRDDREFTANSLQSHKVAAQALRKYFDIATEALRNRCEITGQSLNNH